MAEAELRLLRAGRADAVDDPAAVVVPDVLPAQTWHFAVSLIKEDDGETVWTGHVKSEAGMEQRDLRRLRLSVPVRLEAGLYRIVCEAESESGNAAP